MTAGRRVDADDRDEGATDAGHTIGDPAGQRERRRTQGLRSGTDASTSNTASA